MTGAGAVTEDGKARMRNIAVVTLPLAGHLNPTQVVVDGLLADGHKVTLVGPPGMDGLLDGVAFRALADADYPAGRLTRLLTLLPSIRGVRGVRAMIDEIAALSALYIRQLPAALEAVGADLVLSDQLEPAAGLVARGLGLAHASLACALPMNREPTLPPPYLGWRYREGAYGEWLYQGGYRVVDWMMAPQGDVLARGAEHFGLPVRRATADWVSPTTDLSQCIPGLDYPRVGGPREVGPLRGRKALIPLDFERDGRDLVFCSLGTLMGGRVRIFERVARACDRLGAQVVIAHGGRLSAREIADLEDLPGRPVLRAFVDQPSVLSAARAAVLHGGFNSVLDSLASGVPMVVVPLAFEQRAIAARVERAGAGVTVPPLARGRLSGALGEVLESRDMRRCALELAAGAAQAGGVDQAVAAIADTMAQPRRPDRAHAADGPGHVTVRPDKDALTSRLARRLPGRARLGRS